MLLVLVFRCTCSEGDAECFITFSAVDVVGSGAVAVAVAAGVVVVVDVDADVGAVEG